MKKCSIVIMLISAFLILSGCTQSRQEDIVKWDCSVTIPANSEEIVLSETLIKTNTGELSIQNQSEMEVTLYLYDGKDKTKPIYQMNMKVGSAATIYELDNNLDYYVGIQGNSETNEEVNILVSNIQNQEPY